MRGLHAARLTWMRSADQMSSPLSGVGAAGSTRPCERRRSHGRTQGGGLQAAMHVGHWTNISTPRGRRQRMLKPVCTGRGLVARACTQLLMILKQGNESRGKRLGFLQRKFGQDKVQSGACRHWQNGVV